MPRKKAHDKAPEEAPAAQPPPAEVMPAGEAPEPQPPPEAVEPPEQPAPDSAEPRMLVVALGASAGGMAPLKHFLQAMPSDSGMAFVVIQHLDPKHESFMAPLLSRHTQMRVEQVTEGMALEPNAVFFIPPGKTMTLHNGILHLREPEEPHGMRLPIDAFFASLAEDQQDRAVSIVMSGTASDGTEGVRHIKAEGGLVIAQKPEEAEHDWMPRSAIGTGLVDLVLMVEEMPGALIGYRDHPYHAETEEVPPGEETDVLAGILAVLKTRLGHDFRGYRKSTLLRRIHRRMGFKRIQDLVAYREALRDDPAEIQALFADFLIGVTKFFREPEAWEKLKETVVRPLLERDGDQPIRAWTPGCATGKEAYSLAIVFFAIAEELDVSLDLQVFATDIDQDALAYARAGLYPAEIADEVPPEYLKRFFSREDKHYRIAKKLRQAVVFAPQNALSDPPFSRLDLISCRNLLIYLESDVQERLLKVFHFALRSGGFLFLGNSESLGAGRDLFAPVHKEHRIYQKVGRSRPDVLAQVFSGHHMPSRAEPSTHGRESTRAEFGEQLSGVHRLAEGLVLEQFAPASVVINSEDEVTYYLGRTDDYLTNPRGAPTDQLLTRLPQALRGTVRDLIGEARTSGRKAAGDAHLRRGEQQLRVTVQALPLPGTRHRGLLLVVFDECLVDTEPCPGTPGEESDTVRRLEEDLRSSREEMQSAIEEMESANEELTASNEEIVTMNEELQSANEELETSKEELQSLNEELRTVNAELGEKIEQLECASNDVENLLRSTNMPTLFLDQQLRLHRYTPATTRLFNLLPGDVGRPISDLSLAMVGTDLVSDAQGVLEHLQPVTREVRDERGNVYIHRTQPYRTVDNAIEGVVMTFVDITKRKQIERMRDRLAAIVDSSKDAIISIDREGLITTWNAAAERLYGYARAEIIGQPYLKLAPEAEQDKAGEALGRTHRGETVALEGTVRLRKDGSLVTASLALSPIRDAQGEPIETSAIERVLG
jgi:two-component system CheB/CheR fusion protein